MSDNVTNGPMVRSLGLRESLVLHPSGQSVVTLSDSLQKQRFTAGVVCTRSSGGYSANGDDVIDLQDHPHALAGQAER